MKKNATLLFASILVAVSIQAQVTYNVTSNKSWKDNYPASCINCTFNIANGVTLTVDKNIVLQNPVFNGGTIVVDNKDIVIQTSGGKSAYFNNTTLIMTGNNGSITTSAPVYITNSVFTLNDKSHITSQQLFDLTNSRIYFNENSYLLATGGPVNLRSNSMLIAGDGLANSKAYVFFNGPQLNLYDNSAIIVANTDNYYFNWSTYRAATAGNNITTTNNNKNCGGGNPNSCSPPYVYGPVNLLQSGISQGNILPVVLSDFSVRLENNITQLSWTTDQENNSSRFDLERSSDGVKWTTIATIAAKGNSSIQSKYAYVDRTPAAGINYYRLKMVDLDNTFEFSVVIQVRTEAFTNLRVYPNPAKNVVNVSLPATAASVRLLNTAGQVLQDRKTVSGNSTIAIDVSNYTAGTYMVQVKHTDGTSRNSVLLVTK